MTESTTLSIGMDLSDRKAHLHVREGRSLTGEDEIIALSEAALTRYFSGLAPCKIAMEVGGQSRWISNLLMSFGHTVFVANARKLRAISDSVKKNDRTDAEMICMILQANPELLSPIQHRGDGAQRALAVLRARDSLVRVRTLLINHVRGVSKASGVQVRKCSAESFRRLPSDALPEDRFPALKPLMTVLQSVGEQIDVYEELIKTTSRETFPETELLRQVPGVGPITALAFAATVEDTARFPQARKVAAYFGLAPRQDQSGKCSKQLGIAKSGDGHVRRLLVISAQYILGPFGPDSDLRRWGLQLCARGSKNAKKLAVTAVARKLTMLLLALWRTQVPYEPLRNNPAPDIPATSCQAQETINATT